MKIPVATQVSQVLSGVGSLLNGAQGGSPPLNGLPKFDKGGTVPKTEVAVVHKGEHITPAGENMSEHKQSDISFHRSMSHLQRGGLHRALGVSPDKELPKDMVEKATRSNNKHVKAMAIMAQNMSKWSKG